MKRKFIPETDFEREEFRDLIDAIREIEYPELPDNFEDKLFKEIEKRFAKEAGFYKQLKEEIRLLTSGSHFNKKSKSTRQILESELENTAKKFEEIAKPTSNKSKRLNTSFIADALSNKQNKILQHKFISKYKKLIEIKSSLQSIDSLSNKDLYKAITELREIKSNLEKK